MKREIVLILLVSVFLVIFCCFENPCKAERLYAQEKNDISLFEIDRLIRLTEYDEALRQLNIYIEKNPEKFDNAQTRIKKIMNARNQYSILAEKLINLIQSDPGNNKEIYEITAQLEKFEKHPSDQNLKFIADLKKSAEFNYFRALFLEIQNATADLSHQGQYVAAIEKAKEGFWLYRDNFYESQDENSELVRAVNATLAELDLRMAEFEEKNYLLRFNNVVNDFIRTLKAEQYEQAWNKFSDVEISFRNYNTLRNRIVKVGSDLQSQFAEMQKADPDLTDASFLPFMFRFVFGIDSIADSGILGAIDAQWNEAAGKMNDAVYTELVKKYDNYQKGLNQLFVAEVSRYARLENRVLDLYKLSETASLDEVTSSNQLAHSLVNPYEPYYALSAYAENISSQAFRISELYSQVQAEGRGQERSIANKEIDALFESNRRLLSLTGDKQSQNLNSFDWTWAYQTACEKTEHRDFDGLSELYTQTLDSIFDESAVIYKKSWTEITAYYKSSSDTVYENVLAYYNSGEKYRNGFFTKIPQTLLTELKADISKSVLYEDSFNSDPDLDFGIYYSYPDLSLQIANYTQTVGQNGIKTIDGFERVIVENYALGGGATTGEVAAQSANDSRGVAAPLSEVAAQSATGTQYAAAPLSVASSQDVAALVSDARAYMEAQRQKMRKLVEGAQEQASLARRQITASQLARNEADIRYSEAERALRAEDFDTARKKLQDALSKYDEALTNQNDELLREETDRKLQTLGQSIAKAENELVVREVRELKTLAKDAYFNGRFDDAEKYLNQAKIRWAVTNVDEDEEITNLLNFVNTAISMKTGREILPSAPQYPEMSQLLNIAYQYFDEGSRKIGEGNRSAGEADLALALESIQKLQYVYPLNQEASILTLRINRLLDPKKFNEEFAQKIEMAKMMCKSKDTQQEGYANLLDYYELDPSYKGLKDLIYQVEIDIGIRQKPVSNSGTNRAKNLLAEAQKIYNSAGNDTTKLQNALSKVDEALTLLSDNQEAMALKDKITTKIGGNTSTVLSTEDERLYQLAIQRLQNNNVVGANAIVEQLLKKPQNSNSQKIKDLKNKIEARS